MNPHSLEPDYISLCKAQEVELARVAIHWPWLNGFWENWCNEHRRVLLRLSSQETIGNSAVQEDVLWSALLTQRKRLISALSQGLNDKTLGIELRLALSRLIADHDKAYVTLLQKELERVKEQMNYAFAMKKTVSAYANSAQYRGE